MKKIKVLIVNNEYGDYSKMYYRWDDDGNKFWIDGVMDEVKVNLEAGYPINLKFVEMTEKEFEKIPIIN